MRNDQGMRLCVKSRNSFCDFCAICGEPEFLTRSHLKLKTEEHHRFRQNDLPRCDSCKKLVLFILSILCIHVQSVENRLNRT